MGTVFLVGAGPGDPELLTRRAYRLVRRADVILHDALVDPRVLRLARSDARLIDVGKRAGVRACEQEEIEALLVQEARRARAVVRLKGGDPLLFARGGEEAAALAAAGVPFEIVPGITAAFAAFAATGVPATHRGVTGAVTLVTGHRVADGAAGGIDWRALARTNSTLVIYMATQTIAEITNELLAGGMAAATPVAVVESVGWLGQRVIEATLADLARVAADARVVAPAVFIIGHVVKQRTLSTTDSQ